MVSRVTTRAMVPISIGELVDKVTILSIKREVIKDADRLFNVEREWKLLREKMLQAGITELHQDYQRLRDINSRLWGIEDRIRQHERRKDFGITFLELARSVYLTNDQRSRVKREINDATGSEIVEEKELPEYA